MANQYLCKGLWRWQEPDLPNPTYTWESPATEFTATQLPTRKSQELQQQTLMAISQGSEPNSVVYYTDSSVDPGSGETGATLATEVMKQAFRS